MISPGDTFSERPSAGRRIRERGRKPLMDTLNGFRTVRALGVVLPLLLVASAGCDIAMAEHKAKETAEWKKSYELQPGGRFEIGNVNGRIQILPGQGNTIEVVATKIGHGMTSEAA